MLNRAPLSSPRLLPLLLSAGLSACAAADHAPAPIGRDASVADGSTEEAGPGGADASGPSDAPGDVDKAASCASTFGSALTNAFGRLDGTVAAVVPPNDQACALPNSTHLILEVMMQGAVYRMVVDVLSTTGTPTDVLFYEMDAPLAGDPWSDGWHTTAVALDYATTLSLHSTPFVSMSQADLVAKITSEIPLGAHVSVFATSAGEANSAHLVHRNLTNQDGAIVLSPETAPHYLLIRFVEQSF